MMICRHLLLSCWIVSPEVRACEPPVLTPLHIAGAEDRFVIKEVRGQVGKQLHVSTV